MQPDRRSKVKSRLRQSLLRILIVISFAPALCWAQAEINPDHFDPVSNVAAIENKAMSNGNSSQASGSFFLPYDVKCAGVTLAPGYYSVLFEDPDGIRLEVCFVPGAGLLGDDASFDPSRGYI